MRPFILFSIFFTLAANFASGQSVEAIANNLIAHNVINDSDKEEIIKILVEEDDTSNLIILKALGFVETSRLIGKENMRDNSDSMMAKMMKAALEESNHNQALLKEDLLNYLTQLESAGIVTPGIFDEIKPDVENGKCSFRLMLIMEITQKVAYAQYLKDAIVTTNRKNNLTKEQIQNAINGWQKIGILDHLSKAEILLADKKASEETTDNINDVLYRDFPKVIHWFDTELENLKDPYAELLREFARISHGGFNPGNISDNFDPSKKSVTVKFALNHKNYSKDFRILDDWVDPDFIDFVMQTIAENKLAGQFYDLYEGGQGAYFIFLTLQQYEFLKSNKLLVFADSKSN